MQNIHKFINHKTLLLFCLLWLPVHVMFSTASIQHDLLWHGNRLTLLIILFGCVGVSLTDVLRYPVRIWYPITWFLLTVGIYYGFGPLIYYFGDSGSIAHSEQFFPVTQTDLHRVSLLVLIGVLIVLATYLALQKMFLNKFSLQTIHLDHSFVKKDDLRKIVLFFLTLGILIKYLLQIPYALGLVPVSPPGILNPLGDMVTLSVIPLYILFRSGGRVYAIPLVLVLVAELITSFALLSKQAIFEVFIVFILAAVLLGINKKVLILIVLGLTILYIGFLSTFVLYARVELRDQGLGSLANIVSEFISTSNGSSVISTNSSAQIWWVRLNYAPVQAFSIRSYEIGLNGTTFELIPFVFIPRTIFPNKPTMTSGPEFNYLVNGNSDSQSSPTVFAEAYWNGGWPAVILVSLFIGILYWVFESYTQGILTSLRLEYLPVVWIVIATGLRQDTWFVPTFIGSVSFAIVFHILVRTFVTPLIVQQTQTLVYR